MDYWEDVDPLLVLMVVIKGPYGGVLLLAVALDANNGLFPVAFAIVESEQNETWRWFFYWLNNFVGAWPRDKPWTFMSDRKKVNKLCCIYFTCNIFRYLYTHNLICSYLFI